MQLFGFESVIRKVGPSEGGAGFWRSTFRISEYSGLFSEQAVRGTEIFVVLVTIESGPGGTSPESWNAHLGIGNLGETFVARYAEVHSLKRIDENVQLCGHRGLGSMCS